MSENTKPEPRVSMRSQSTVTHRSNLERLPILVDSMRNGVASLLERWMKTEGAAAGHAWLPDSEVSFMVDEFKDEVLDDDGNPYDPPRLEPYTRITAERPYIEGMQVVAPAGWCAPSDAIFALEDATEPFDAIPEVRVLRGETWEQAGERIRAARAARRNAAIAAGIPEDALDGKQAPQAMSQRGRWEYAARGTDGEMSLSFPTALEAFEETLFAADDVVVRRWVEESDWEVVS